MAISKIGRFHTADVFRHHGYVDDATAVEARHEHMMAEARAWKEKLGGKAVDKIARTHGSILGRFILPTYGEGPWLTADALRPARLLDYVIAEQFLLVMIIFIYLMILLYACLKYCRLHRRVSLQDDHAITASPEGGLQSIAYGVVMPLVLYAIFVASPIPGRDENIILGLMRNVPAWVIFSLWLVIVPPVLLANDFWRQMKLSGISSMPAPTLLARIGASLATTVWAVAAFFSIFRLLALCVGFIISAMPPQLFIQSLNSPNTYIALATVLVAFLPSLWERRQLEAARYQLALTRTLIPLYTVVILILAMLLSPLRTRERHLLAADHVLNIYINTNAMGMGHAEYQLVEQLRATMLKPEPIGE